jgi:hypothetical protein
MSGVLVETVSTAAAAAVSLIVTIVFTVTEVCSEVISCLIITTDISNRFWVFGWRQDIQFPSQALSAANPKR